MMTRTGCICMIVIMALAAFGILFGRVRGKDFSTPLRSARNDRRANAGAVLPTVTGEPVIFRAGELRFVTCKSSMDLDGFIDEWGLDMKTKEGRDEVNKLSKKELAYLLAEQLLGSGAIRFSMGGHTRYAELRAVLQEEGAGHGT